ncbi:hypothetical protein CHLRE_02g113800v5 [Chlamydomonas reinhardtii]|uniref:Uncharacterized protein n=1 Tax=Chlamydomonas reinhardtii TaxID=3055 RepID=A0A2K3E361_CHLRE|nr:uncharacterized protein CHLRE_02g113800v5 [Chlamydomonas reinhardtii]PNW87221.1 hypothetical protein CHLRE_02g113800v5 [Chlamydomonas reinhardtii]
MPASIPRCEILLPSRPTGLVVRHRVDGASCAAASGSAAVAFETLVFFPDRVCALEGGGGLSPWRLGPQLRLTDGATRASHLVCDSTPCATYCAATGCVYFVEGYAILRLDGANVVTPVAGCSTECDQVDAVGRDARFGCIRAMTADGRGNLCEPCIRCGS